MKKTKNKGISSSHLEVIKKYLKLITILLSLLVLSLVANLFFQINQSRRTNTTKNLADSQFEKDMKGEEENFTVRTPSEATYKNWKRIEIEDFVVYIPQSWNYSKDSRTIFNWDPNSINRSSGLEGDQAKWDVSFSQEKYSSPIESLIRYKTDGEDVKTESSVTRSGLKIYFATYLPGGSEEFNLPHVKMSVDLSNGQYLIWNGLSVKQENLETLKQIAESISYLK